MTAWEVFIHYFTACMRLSAEAGVADHLLCGDQTYPGQRFDLA
jgi:hypothetical protein